MEDWAFVMNGDPYTPPELASPRLVGNVRGHNRLGDRDNQTTSRIMGKTEDGKLVTRNTVYELGAVAEKYEEMFPGAKDRLLSQLPVLEVVYPVQE